MPSLFFQEFLSQHQLKVGDKATFTWKNTPIQGIILPQPNDKSLFVHIKLDSGYNTGLSISAISAVQKMVSPSTVFETASIVKKTSNDHVHKNNHPALSLITAGGTIGSKVDYKNAGVSALMTAEELTALIPEMDSFAHFDSIISPFSKMSENFTPNDWITIATLCEKELNNPKIKGVLLTHGTDTLHYTAAALSFMLSNLNKPVVLVGAQRSSDRGSSDAHFNLICAARFALSDIAEVGICMHESTSDDYCLLTRGTKVRKMHSSRRDAFRPINDVPIGKTTPEGKIDFISSYQKRDDSKKVKLDAVFENNIVSIKAIPGRKPDTIDYHLSQGVKGFIIEGTGLGHISQEWIPFIKKATDKGICVFVTTQTIYGRANLNVYSTGRLMQEAGAIGLEDMLSEVAYVKLGWVLGHTKDAQKVKEMMLTNYAGELSPFSRVDTFLK